MEKFDFKKKYKYIYNPKKPDIVTMPSLKYITLTGEGNPNGKHFQNSIAALYAFSYTISMSYKGEYKMPGFYNYVVPPFEGHWDIIGGNGYDGNKDNLKWKIRMPQPEFVTDEVFEWAKKTALNKKKLDRINDLKFEVSKEKESCLYLHIGPYDNESKSFELMEKFVKNTEYKRSEKTHTEIYISDLRKTAPEKLKTVLCFNVE